MDDIRIEKGALSAEETAAVVAVVLARAATARAAAFRDRRAARAARSTAGWTRLERSFGFRCAHSWQKIS
ncbi:acyl-CoA carboxylase epsilon subunit [Actinomadura atramentaria]|uniref:acyl-CoA carboxylase epsilon subunit n=1 Tax=Actinomadura atramentaria TaxID=1990 RepID=UPI000382E1EA|nr:acyl-CoA carboxylase epsilon subunit [Actinomadura atramentaria]